MSYFEIIEVGDKIKTEINGIEKVAFVFEKCFITENGLCVNFDGYMCDCKSKKQVSKKQIAFWCDNQILQDSLKKLKGIEAGGKGYLIDISFSEPREYECEYISSMVGIPECDIERRNGLLRKNKKEAQVGLNKLRIIAKLLALRDQECKNSKGYEYNFSEPFKNYIIYYDVILKKWSFEQSFHYRPSEVYFASIIDVVRICDILNSAKFNLEG